MPGVVWIVLRVAPGNDLTAELEQRFLKFRHTLAGFNFDVERSTAEFIPELGIGHKAPRLFMRESRPFCDTAQGVIHRPVQRREEWYELLPASFLLSSHRLFRSPDSHIDQEIALNRRLAEV